MNFVKPANPESLLPDKEVINFITNKMATDENYINYNNFLKRRLSEIENILDEFCKKSFSKQEKIALANKQDEIKKSLDESMLSLDSILFNKQEDLEEIFLWGSKNHKKIKNMVGFDFPIKSGIIKLPFTGTCSHIMFNLIEKDCYIALIGKDDSIVIETNLNINEWNYTCVRAGFSVVSKITSIGVDSDLGNTGKFKVSVSDEKWKKDAKKEISDLVNYVGTIVISIIEYMVFGEAEIIQKEDISVRKSEPRKNQPQKHKKEKIVYLKKKRYIFPSRETVIHERENAPRNFTSRKDVWQRGKVVRHYKSGKIVEVAPIICRRTETAKQKSKNTPTKYIYKK